MLLPLRPSSPLARSNALLLASLLALLCVTGCAQGELPEVEPDLTVMRPDMTMTIEEDMAPPAWDFGGYDFAGPRSEEMGFVTSGCDVLEQNCATQNNTPHKCVFDTQWATICVPFSQQSPVGSACSGVHQCDVGAVCVNWGDARGTQCEKTCPLELSGGCPVGERCADSLPMQDTIGLCAPGEISCDIIQQDCAAGDCVLKRHADTGKLEQLCGVAGSVGEGQPCGGANGSCQAGMICVKPPEVGVQVCARVCMPPQAGEVPICQGDTSCAGQTVDTGLRYCL